MLGVLFWRLTPDRSGIICGSACEESRTKGGSAGRRPFDQSELESMFAKEEAVEVWMLLPTPVPWLFGGGPKDSRRAEAQ